MSLNAYEKNIKEPKFLKSSHKTPRMKLLLKNVTSALFQKTSSKSKLLMDFLSLKKLTTLGPKLWSESLTGSQCSKCRVQYLFSAVFAPKS